MLPGIGRKCGSLSAGRMRCFGRTAETGWLTALRERKELQMSTIEIASARQASANCELLRVRLERNRAERKEQLHQLSAVRPDNDNAPDVVADVYRASVERILSEIEAALRRMGDDTFGRCESCGEVIPTERLESVPHAIRCVGCAERWVRDR